MDFEKYYSDRQKLINNFLEKRMQKKGISRVDEAMAYSLFAGGKRIRPILLMATADAVGANGYNFLPGGKNTYDEINTGKPISSKILLQHFKDELL